MAVGALSLRSCSPLHRLQGRRSLQPSWQIRQFRLPRRVAAAAVEDRDRQEVNWDQAWADYKQTLTGDQFGDKVGSHVADIRSSEDAMLDFFSHPGFFLGGGATVLVLLVIFVVAEATG